MNLPETVAEVAAEANADAVGVSNLLGLGVTLFPRVEARLKELGIRDKIDVYKRQSPSSATRPCCPTTPAAP